MSQSSSVGDRRSFGSDGKEKYSTEEVASVTAHTGINVKGYQNPMDVMNDLHEEQDQKRMEDRFMREPAYAATMHGNKPSKGAKIDAEIAREEAEMMEKKSASLAGKK
ncbi:unnamed protein product [Clonostachys rosea]|uniref:SMP domain-containing protein n=1 Tax=Bionectria ochroleuca TaxID=29856 RepID=A0ABY6UMZ2_BIOOC|nr:unnamed protein product [Clonostachys rosea]